MRPQPCFDETVKQQRCRIARQPGDQHAEGAPQRRVRREALKDGADQQADREMHEEQRIGGPAQQGRYLAT